MLYLNPSSPPFPTSPEAIAARQTRLDSPAYAAEMAEDERVGRVPSDGTEEPKALDRLDAEQQDLPE